ncbi:acyl-CoA thioesterase-1 [Solimonas aquatica]|uniref:Acyl-CoA thioesterase-1 n=1 Tax=Solimonas aquatica TaxID=489703 RepID=A0A1H9F725_9GAMM|nr:acyl-CoA thioesterase-1 [Solimonas aquatica]
MLVLLCTALQARADAPTWLVLGDSISAGYGIEVSRGWVALLQERLKNAGYPARIVNASVSGDTSAGGLARLPALLTRHRPRLVLIELGGNDGLRGLPVAKLRDNLKQMVLLTRQAGAQPVLMQMRIPRNYGPAYSQQFEDSYTRLAQELKVPLAPFLMDRFALDPNAFQDDGIHPAAAMQGRMLDTVWPTLAALAKAK